MNKIYILPINTDAYGFIKRKASQKHNIDIGSLIIERNKHGKPYFKNLADFYFNISHSGEYLAVAISQQNVGIDIQKARPFNQSVIKRFHSSEIEYINSTDTENRFFEIWTKKEACLKYLGSGISGGLDSFCSLDFSPAPKTFYLDEYYLSVCGHYEFEIIIEKSPNL